MRVIVCGSRRWHDREAISDRLGALVFEFAPDYPVIVHGGARGADRLAGEEALKHGLLVEVHEPDYGAEAKRDCGRDRRRPLHRVLGRRSTGRTASPSNSSPGER